MVAPQEAGEFDAIVVGAGSAGSVVARRLVDSGRRVLLLEAGGEDTNPAIHEPTRMHELWHSPDDWDYYSVPQVHAAGRRLHLPRGKVLGGSHALNGMVFVRGPARNYDDWAAAGNDGWSWRDVLPVFKSIETFDRGADEHHGDAGPLDLVTDPPLHPVQESILEAGVEAGLTFNDDYNGEHIEGISRQQITARDGKRLTTYGAYVRPLLDGRAPGASDLTVSTGCWVHRLLLDGAGGGLRVRGVEYERNGSLGEARAPEVVLCAGAIDSPRVLLRSGIGPADEVRALGLDAVLDVPGVGRNLQDHFLVPVVYATDAREVGPLEPGMAVMQTHVFARSRPDLPVPDLQPVHFSTPSYEQWMTGPPTGFTLMAGLVRPASRGTVRLADADPHGRMLIDPQLFARDADLDALLVSLHQCRELGAAPALAAGWGARELYPGPGLSEADERDYLRRATVTYHHASGTCRMGPDSDPDAVVDPRLRVRGVAGLRVADASIMPTITSANTNAPTIMIGEQAAAFVTGAR